MHTCALSRPRAVAEERRSIQQFVDYLEMFARYKELNNLTAMGGVLDANPQFTMAERAMLGRKAGSLGCAYG
jgi:hypothetical protein